MSGEILKNYDADKNNLIDPKELAIIDADLKDGNAIDDVVDELNKPSVLDACITLLQDSKKDKTPEEQAKYDVVISLLQSKRDKFVGPEVPKQSETISEAPKQQGEMLTVMDQFDANVLELLQELQSGKVDINNVDNLSAMGNFLNILHQSTDRKWNMTVFTASLQKKIDAITYPTQKEKCQKLLINLQPTIDALADPKSVLSQTADKIGSSIDTHLNGSSYDKLLADASDPNKLDTPDSKKAMANIFLRDEKMFHELVNNSSFAKDRIDNIVRKYYQLQNGKILPEGTIITARKDIGKDDKNPGREGFEIKNVDGTLETIAFGDQTTGKPQKLSELLSDKGPTWLKGKENGMFDIDVNGKMILGTALAGVLGVEGGVAKVLAGKTFSNMFEAIGEFFKSPIFDEIKKFFLMLKGLKGLNKEDNVELSFLKSKDDVKNFMSTPDYKRLESENLIPKGLGYRDLSSKIESYPWNQIDSEDKKSKINNFEGSQKDYFANYLSPENKIRFVYKKTLVDQGGKPCIDYPKDPAAEKVDRSNQENAYNKLEPINTSTANTESKIPESQKQTGGKELTSGQSDALKLNPSMDATKIKGEVKLSDDKKSLLVDNQVVVLQPSADGKISSGAIRVRDKDNKGFVEHSLTVDAAGKISIAEGTTPTSLDTSNTKIKETYDAKKMKFPIVPGNESLFNYFAFSKSVDEKKSNVIDAVYTSLAQDTAAMEDFQTKFAKLQSDFATGNKTAESMKTLINQSGLDAVVISDPKQKPAFTAALNDWKSMFTAEAPKTVTKASIPGKKS